jgi:2-polyprenyl-3-methyl-5-hydroxy-6-metoxy-1,4-benzoquinol methylase
MRYELLDIVCCPDCGSRLQLAEDPANQGRIDEGSLLCTGCAKQYPVVKGIPQLYLDDEAWLSKKIEAQGWVDLHKQQGIYEPDEDAVDLSVPYVDEGPWPPIAKAFDLALELLDISGGEQVLDLGAGRGWAAKHFALRGCRAVAMDIVPDENIGLGRSYALMKQAQVEFDPLIGDGEKLPFFPHTFDIVFCCAVLHHATDLSLLLKNVNHVLKPGGLLCAISEPCLSIWQNEERVLQNVAGDELSLGINESLPTFGRYLSALDSQRLQVVQAFPSDGYQGEDTDWPRVAQSMGAMWTGIDTKSPVHSLKGSAGYLARRSIAFARGSAPPAYQHVRDEDGQAQVAILTWCGGELFLLARKP